MNVQSVLMTCLLLKKNKKNTSEVMDGCHGINSVCIGSTSTSVQVVPQW